MRTGTRESPSWPGRCPETGYVDADCSDLIAKTSCGRAGHTFLKVMPWRTRKRNSAVRLPGIRRLCTAATNSSSVQSRCSSISPTISSAYFSSAERLPPHGLASIVPAYTMPLAACVEKVGLTKQHWVSPLHYTPRFGDQSEQSSQLDP